MHDAKLGQVSRTNNNVIRRRLAHQRNPLRLSSGGAYRVVPPRKVIDHRAVRQDENGGPRWRRSADIPPSIRRARQLNPFCPHPDHRNKTGRGPRQAAPFARRARRGTFSRSSHNQSPATPRCPPSRDIGPRQPAVGPAPEFRDHECRRHHAREGGLVKSQVIDARAQWHPRQHRARRQHQRQRHHRALFHAARLPHLTRRLRDCQQKTSAIIPGKQLPTYNHPFAQPPAATPGSGRK